MPSQKLTIPRGNPTLSLMSTLERLQIKNFGPIRQADIEVRDITILLGPQATGKSLTAQTLYFMRGMEELLIPTSWGGGKIPGDGYIARQELPGKVSALLANWLGVGGINYKETSICWSIDVGGSFREYQLELPLSKDGQAQPRINQRMAERIEKGVSLLPSELFPVEEQIYIPAGRILYSFVPPSLGMFLLSQRQDAEWPGYINVFYRKLGTAIRTLHDMNRRNQPILDDWLKEKILKIMKGQLTFTSLDGISLVIQDKFTEGEDFTSRSWAFNALKLASGQMELWPFWVSVAAAFESQRSGSTRVFFEEPEAHLHPSAQIALLESIAQLTRRNLRFVLTTHSPYIVYALNNCLMAQQVVDAGGSLPGGVSQETLLQREQVSAYRFTNEGKIVSILDKETGLINTEDLDDPAGALNRSFSEMQDIMFELKS